MKSLIGPRRLTRPGQAQQPSDILGPVQVEQRLHELRALPVRQIRPDQPVELRRQLVHAGEVGRLAFRHPELSACELFARWDALGRRSAIVGPHGSGKTTLLRELGRRAEGSGLRVHHWFLNADDPTPRTASRVSIPAMASSTRPQSSAVRAMGPTLSRDQHRVMAPVRLTRP